MLLNKPISVLHFIREIRFSIVYIVLYAVIIGLLDGHEMLKDVVIPLSVSGVVGTALSLLLAFRTSQSYERWWEARTVWGAIVNDSRTLIRQVQLYIHKDNSNEIGSFAERQIIWCYALGESLRRLPFSERVETYLQQYQVNDANIPNALLSQHSMQLKALIEEGAIDKIGLLQIDSTVAKLCDSMGKCERLKNTVFPRNYSLLIHFLIYVFATILPFGLEDKYLLVEIIITASLPLIFIAIEKTAILMQDPFENLPLDTPVTTLAATIEMNLREAVGLDGTNVPAVANNGPYYIM